MSIGMYGMSECDEEELVSEEIDTGRLAPEKLCIYLWGLITHSWIFLAELLDFLVWSLESRRPWKIGWRSRCRNRAWPLNSDIVFCSRRRDLDGDEFPNRWCSASLSSCLKGCDHCINFIWNKVDWSIRFLFFFELDQALACTEIDDGQCREVFLFACHLSCSALSVCVLLLY